MSDWSVWSVCSCVSQSQQRYRVALSPAIRGQQCTPVETQSRACGLGQCDGELKSMLTKMHCIFLHSIFFVLCFSLLISNHIFIVHAGPLFVQIVVIQQGLLEGQLDQSGRDFFWSLSSASVQLKKPLRWEEQCLPVSFNRPVAPPLDLSL